MQRRSIKISILSLTELLNWTLPRFLVEIGRPGARTPERLFINRINNTTIKSICQEKNIK